MDRTTLTRNFTLLEHQQLVSIAPGTDQRTRLVTLSIQGREVLAKALPLWEQAQTCIVSGLGRERWRALVMDLSGIVSLACEAFLGQ
jgi:DNA-binding MarR family transcriptional regulator